MLIGLSYPRENNEDLIADFEEVESLVSTLGGEVVAAIVQNSTRRDSETFIGHGKVEEALSILEKEKVDIVVINENIKPGQLHTLTLAFEKANPRIIVWDRINLILEIFSKHAKTAEAKLQIKFAKLRQMGPRIYGMGFEMSNQAAGIGARGSGESNTELMLRHYRMEKKRIQDELAALSKRKLDQINHRKKDGLPTISLVGYTNAGKSTLFNQLTGQKDLVANILFATLDSTVNKFYLKDLQKEVYLSDTIGFIKDLPPQLIDTFKSTLLESIHADIILHVIDASDPRMQEKITTVEQIFGELDIKRKNVMYVFNKCDMADNLDQEKISKKYEEFSPLFISAKNDMGIDQLLQLLATRLSPQPALSSS
jgi:GTP-binding protein HflX